MNRRQFARLLPAAALLAECDTDQKPDHAATLLNSSGVQGSLKDFSDAINELENDVVRLGGGENWREVVPDMESASSEVRDALDKLRQALGVQDS